MPISPPRAPVLSIAELDALFDKTFPAMHAGGRTFILEEVRWMGARVRLLPHEKHIRPGGTIMGPAMFQLADYGVYAAILATVGESAVQAVTSSLNMTFLNRPEPRDLIGEIRLIKLGRRLAVGEVEMRSEGSEEIVAHAMATYAFPRPG